MLPNNKMLDASMVLASDCNDNLAVPRMKGIKDLNFKRRTPGIMTLVRLASAKPTLPSRSGAKRVKRRWNGTPYRPPKGTPLLDEPGR